MPRPRTRRVVREGKAILGYIPSDCKGFASPPGFDAQMDGTAIHLPAYLNPSSNPRHYCFESVENAVETTDAPEAHKLHGLPAVDGMTLARLPPQPMNDGVMSERWRQKDKANDRTPFFCPNFSNHCLGFKRPAPPSRLGALWRTKILF